MHSTSTVRAAAIAAAVAALVVLVGPGLGARSTGQADDALLKRAAAIMARTPLIDGHNDLPWEMRVRVAYDAAKLDIRQPQPSLQTDIPRLRAGHVGGQFWSVYVPASMSGQTAVVATLEQIAFVHEMARRYPDTFEMAGTAADIERIFKAGKIGSMMGVEGGHSIDSSLPHAAHALHAGRALHDAHPQQQHAVGRRRHRQAGTRRPHRLRRGPSSAR